MAKIEADVQRRDLPEYFDEITTTEINCDQNFYDLITKIYDQLRPFWISQDSEKDSFWYIENPITNPGYTKDTINLVNRYAKRKLGIDEESDLEKWFIRLYICDNDKYEISFSCLIEEDDDSQRHFVDRFGNFYLNEDKFLSTLRYKTYCIYPKPVVKCIPQNKSFINDIEDGMFELFNNNDLFKQFCRHGNAETALKTIITIYPLFSVLLTPDLPKINFIFSSFTAVGNFNIEIGGNKRRPSDRSWYFKSYTLYEYKKFDNFKKYVENSATSCAFTQDCEDVLMSMQEIISWNKKYPEKLENYKWQINKKMGRDQILARACHNLAKKIVEEHWEQLSQQRHEHEDQQVKQIPLNQFKFVIYWVRIKLISYWDEEKKDENQLKDIERDENIVQDFLDQFTKLYTALKNFSLPTFPHKFRSHYSEVYHLNMHYNDIKVAVDDLENCPPEIQSSFDILKAISTGLDVEEAKIMRPLIKNNIKDITEAILNGYASFYINAVPTFIFQDFVDNEEHLQMGFYTKENTDDTDFTRTYYVAGHSLTGIKAYENVSTIYGMIKEENSVL